MFVRRLIAHFRGQNLTPKEITAVGVDLIIVVLGVFVGLQAQAWNESRQDRFIPTL